MICSTNGCIISRDSEDLGFNHGSAIDELGKSPKFSGRGMRLSLNPFIALSQ